MTKKPNAAMVAKSLGLTSFPRGRNFLEHIHKKTAPQTDSDILFRSKSKKIIQKKKSHKNSTRKKSRAAANDDDSDNEEETDHSHHAPLTAVLPLTFKVTSNCF